MDDSEIMVLVDFGEGFEDLEEEDEMVETSVFSSIAERLSNRAGKSRESIATSLNVIGWVSQKAKATIDGLTDKPDTVELEFGIKVGSKAGMLVAQADAEFHIKAKVIWTNK